MCNDDNPCGQCGPCEREAEASNRARDAETRAIRSQRALGYLCRECGSPDARARLSDAGSLVTIFLCARCLVRRAHDYLPRLDLASARVEAGYRRQQDRRITRLLEVAS